MENLYSFKVKNSAGQDVSLEEYKGKVLLIVNVASKCGFTYQYDGVQALKDKFENEDFEILGFPSNEFKEQEPGTDTEIQDFCRMNYGVTFPVFAKTSVLGEGKSPLYEYLINLEPREWIDVPEGDKLSEFFREYHGGYWGKEIVWNFNKFLFDCNGQLIGRYASHVEPKDLEDRIEGLLRAGRQENQGIADEGTEKIHLEAVDSKELQGDQPIVVPLATMGTEDGAYPNQTTSVGQIVPPVVLNDDLKPIILDEDAKEE